MSNFRCHLVIFWTFSGFSTVFECLDTADSENEVIFHLTGLKIGLKRAFIFKISRNLVQFLRSSSGYGRNFSVLKIAMKSSLNYLSGISNPFFSNSTEKCRKIELKIVKNAPSGLRGRKARFKTHIISV